MCPAAQIQPEETIVNKAIRCVLVHDHVLLRQGLRRLLEDEPDMEVVAEAGNAAEALRNVFEHRPEVVITDAHVFECAVEQTKRLILQESPQSRVVFITAQDADLWEAQGDGINCAGCQTSAEALVQMVRRTHAAQWMVMREMPERRQLRWPTDELLPRKRVLTVREREVLKLLAEGRTVRSAAEILGLSIKTVDAHKFNLMRKLGIHNKAELVMWAIQKRVVKLPASL